MPSFDLFQSTGLSPNEVAEVLQANPRAYMAVRGAVSEKHLEKIVLGLVADKTIADYRMASGDSDKDFYIQVGNLNLSLECKNIEVIKTSTKGAKVSYLQFLFENKFLSEVQINDILKPVGYDLNALSGAALSDAFKRCPQEYRESGLSKYSYSAAMLNTSELGKISDRDFLEQFHGNQLTIDFQRTRNSTDDDGDTKRNRFYRVGEIDIVGACLFSRTMRWEFLYARAESFERHSQYRDRYSNRLRLLPGLWHSDIRNVL